MEHIAVDSRMRVEQKATYGMQNIRYIFQVMTDAVAIRHVLHDLFVLFFFCPLVLHSQGLRN